MINSTGSSTLTLSGSATALTYSATNNPLTATISVAALDLNGGTDTFTVNHSTSNPTSDLTISSVVQDGALVKAGVGILTLTGSNTYAGGTTINAGTLAINSDNALGNGGSVTFATDAGNDTTTLLANGTVTSTRNFILSNVPGAIFNPNGNTITLNGPGVVSGADGLVLTGSGTLVLNGANTYGTGVAIGTTINGGTLSVSTDGNLGNAGDQVSINNGATLLLGGGFSSSRKINLGAVTSGTTPQNGGSSVAGIVSVTSGTATLTGQILGGFPTSSLEVTGAGLLFLNNTTAGSLNAFSGGLYIHGGTVRTGNGPQFGDSLLTQDNGGTLISNQVGVFTANVYLGTGGGVRESGTGDDVIRLGPILNVTGETGGLTLQGDQTAAGGSAANAGKVGLGGVNTFIGNVTVNQNFTLSISQDANLGDKGTLYGGTGSINSGSGNALILNGGTLAIEDGAMFNPLTSATTAVAATFATSRPISLSGTSTIFVSNTNDPNNPAGFISHPAGYKNVFTVNGLVSGAGSLTKTGSGTLVLTDANTYGGGTTVNAGTLQIGNASGSATGSGGVLINGGAFLSGIGTIGTTTTVGGVVIAGGSNAATQGTINLVDGQHGDIEHPGHQRKHGADDWQHRGE